MLYVDFIALSAFRKMRLIFLIKQAYQFFEFKEKSPYVGDF
jgi:hypothetical protein